MFRPDELHSGGRVVSLALAVVCLTAGVRDARSDDGTLVFESPLQVIGTSADGLAAQLELNVQVYNAIKRRAHVSVAGFVAAPGRSFDLELEQFRVFDGQSRFLRDGELAVAAPDVVLLRGHVAGAPESRVFLALSPHGSNGTLEHAGETFLLSTFAPDASEPERRVTMAYRQGAYPPAQADPWSCNVIPLPIVLAAPPATGEVPIRLATGGPNGGGIARGSTCLEAVVAIESDHEYFQIFGSEAAASAYIVTIVGVASNIFERDTGMKLQIGFARVWTTPIDPWTGSRASLGEFQDYWNANMTHIVRTSAHFLSGKGGGGVAYFPGVCYPGFDYALSNVNGSFPAPPISNNGSNWDIHVVTHEWGHTYGAPHTHSLTPPVDTCATNCTPPHQGTIMSYCHICPGGERNIVLEFHNRLQDLIIAQVTSVGCITKPISCSPLLRGDLNCDGAINGADIDAFFLALGDPPAYQARFPDCDAAVLGDMNASGYFNGADIDVFFEVLGGP